MKRAIVLFAAAFVGLTFAVSVANDHGMVPWVHWIKRWQPCVDRFLLHPQVAQETGWSVR